MRTLLLGLAFALLTSVAAAQAIPHESTEVKNTLTYQQFDQLRMATGGELILRTSDGHCLRLVAKPPKPLAAGQKVPDPNFDTDPVYACTATGAPQAGRG